jgi:hypothetical protein
MSRAAEKPRREYPQMRPDARKVPLSVQPKRHRKAWACLFLGLAGYSAGQEKMQLLRRDAEKPQRDGTTRNRAQPDKENGPTGWVTM